MARGKDTKAASQTFAKPEEKTPSRRPPLEVLACQAPTTGGTYELLPDGTTQSLDPAKEEG